MPTPYYWVNKDTTTFLERGYLQKGVTTQQRVKQIGQAAEKILQIPGIGQKIEDYVSYGWFSLSSPIWANFGLPRGLPISCFGSYVADDTASILEKVAEVGMMSKMGGGTSGYIGDVRPRGSAVSDGGKTDGPVRFLELFDKATNVISQGGIRRGHFAAYLPIEHPDVMEFLQIRNDGNAIQDLSIGVTITDAWMKDMIGGNPEKRAIWAKVIQKRFESGYPYVMFSDNVNNSAPKVYRDRGKKILASNLCSEIMLSSSPDESFVCDLSSMNILKFDEWHGTDAVRVMTYLLDAVMTEFIEKASAVRFLSAAVNFAKRQRALGIGTLGWHSYLQEKMIAFESLEAKLLNVKVHKYIYTESQTASAELAVLFGEPELLKGYGLRNVTTMAIAPTTSSSFILGQVSPSIEPHNSNYFVKNLTHGTFTYRNPQLIKILDEKGQNTDEVWKSILIRGGSVQHLNFLTSHEKDVFKTFGELSQKEIVIQAAGRQKWIDQSQSLNIMIPPKTLPKDVSQLLIFGWEQGVKTFYYQRSANPAQELARSILACASCEA